MPRRPIDNKDAALPPLCAAIRQRRLALGVEQKELAARLGIHANAVSNWERGRSRPDFNLLGPLCRALALSPWELLGLDDPAPPLTAGEQTLLARYRRLEPRFQRHAEETLASLLRAQEEGELPDLVEIELQPFRLAAGPDAAIRDLVEPETRFLHASPRLRRADSLYQVNGDSMAPRFHDGELVLVERLGAGETLRVGEIGAFAVGNECFIKEYRPDGLYSYNPAYPPMRFDGETSVYLIGRVLGSAADERFATEEEIARFLRARGGA